MARIVSVGAALQDVFLMDHDDFGTNKKGYFNQFELGSKIDIDKIHFSTGGGATNAATTFARYGHESIFMGCIADDPAGQAVVDAASGGKSFVICRAGRPLVTVSQYVPPKPIRRPGSLKGKIRIADDFDELPDGFEEAFG